MPTYDNDYPMCDPWEASEFRKAVDQISTECDDQCRPDCRGTTYETKITAVPFRRCDNKNLGISNFCNVEASDGLNPPIYGNQVHILLYYHGLLKENAYD